jgi:hypothetical protein
MRVIAVVSLGGSRVTPFWPHHQGGIDPRTFRPVRRQFKWCRRLHLAGLAGGQSAGLAHRFRRTIHVVAATVIHLVASSPDRAKHRRRKAAAKCHLAVLSDHRLGQGSRPSETGQLCAGMRDGEIVLFGKGCYVFDYFWALNRGGLSLARLAQSGGAAPLRVRS